jgi:hypothetical protein
MSEVSDRIPQKKGNEMAVITLQVPNQSQMGYGLGKAIQYGVEYEVKDNLQVELTSADEVRLAKMMVAFQGKLVSSNIQRNVRVDLPKHEA